MSDIDNEGNAITEVQSPGHQLGAAREKMGLSQQQVADSLRLRLSTIKAIELDELEKGVSITFTRGYVRLYAKLVNLDTESLLQSFNQIHQEKEGPTKLQSFSRRTERETHDSRWNVVTYIVIFAVVGLLAYWWYDTHGKDSLTFGQTNTTDNLSFELAAEEEQSVVDEAKEIQSLTRSDNPGAEPISAELTDDDLIVQAASLDAGVSSIDSLASQVSGNTTLSAANESAPAANLAESEDSLTSVDSQEVNALESVAIRFTFLQDCWLSVSDASGEDIAYGVKKAGYEMNLKGVPPIEVNLCPPSRVNIEYQGEDVDLSVYNPKNPIVLTLPITRN